MGTGCFTADILVATKGGDRLIPTIPAGMMVWSFDPNHGCGTTHVVTQPFRQPMMTHGIDQLQDGSAWRLPVGWVTLAWLLILLVLRVAWRVSNSHGRQRGCRGVWLLPCVIALALAGWWAGGKVKSA